MAVHISLVANEKLKFLHSMIEEDNIIAGFCQKLKKKHYIKEENKKWLYIQIYQLPSKERDVLLLSVLWNMKDEEIAWDEGKT